MSDATPSWVTRPGGAAPAAPATVGAARPPVPATLVAALVATVVLAGFQAAHVAGRDELVVGLRVFLVTVVAFQVLLAFGATRRSAGAALGLLVCQLTTAVASLAGGFGDQRLLFAAGAAVVMVLVASSLGAFPSVVLPAISGDGRNDGEGAR